jgi:TatA/E family protein of Tat protein translocase
MVIALIVIGPSKLPDIAKALGKGLAEFRKASQEIKDSFNLEDEINEIKNDLKEGTIDSIGEYDPSTYEEKKDEPSEEISDAEETAAEETDTEVESEDDKKEPDVNE